ncbi:universal stress protein [Streptomyces kaniharaensis]|uniref:Universal stress protein n=1 Tax=Streptomyces kaniharaensis TaxID=212423 RepID=A0A6N7KUM9_9ACTN|nr:universal stress protein [Streptomyces kaniharaensis]MQS13704.1 universal stress protein [Streptomyces kaniharaensis]
MARQPDGRIVVGVDGSPLSRAAVHWAARVAGLTGGPLEAVAVWDFPSVYGEHGLVLPALDGFGPERRAAEILDETLAGCATALDVRRRLSAGAPGPALVAAAEGAALLVLGSRGRSAPPGAALGTVSQYCVHHAPCTVVIVRD